MFLSAAFWLILIIYVLTCGGLVLVILSQEGSKGGGVAGTLGSSMGETFGYGSATPTLRKLTRNLAIAFVLLTAVLTFLGNRMMNRSAEEFRAASGARTAPAAAPAQPAAEAPKTEIKITPAPTAASTPAPANPAAVSSPDKTVKAEAETTK